MPIIARRSDTVNAVPMSWVTTTLVMLERPLDAQDEVVDARRVDRVETRRRLVVEDDLGLESERAREADALLHAAREVARAHRLDARQADELERLVDARLDLFAGHLVPELLAQPVRHVLADVERVEQGRALEEVRDPAAHVGQLAVAHRHDVAPVEDDLARVGPEQADEHLEHDALAAARGAHDGDRLAATDVEVQARVDDLRAEALLDPVEADERLAGPARHRRPPLVAALALAHGAEDSATGCLEARYAVSAATRRISAAPPPCPGVAAERADDAHVGAEPPAPAGPCRRRSRRAERPPTSTQRRRWPPRSSRFSSRRARLDRDPRRRVRLPAGLEALEVPHDPRRRVARRARRASARGPTGTAGTPSLRARLGEALAERLEALARHLDARGGVVAAEAQERVARRGRARRTRRSPQGRAPSRARVGPSSARMIVGFPKREARRPATMPTTPGCHPCLREDDGREARERGVLEHRRGPRR